MKTWLKRFRRSSTVAMRLKAARPIDPAPAELHDAIMRRVRLAARSRENAVEPPMAIWRWLLAPGLAALAGLVLWGVLHEPAPPAPMARSDDGAHSPGIASAPFDLGRSFVAAAPSAAIAPLEEELSHIRDDVRRAMDLVLASLPRNALVQGEPRGNGPRL